MNINQQLFEKALFFVPPSTLDVLHLLDEKEMKAINEKLSSILKIETQNYGVTIPTLYTKASLLGNMDGKYMGHLLSSFSETSLTAITNCSISIIYGIHDRIVESAKTEDFYQSFLSDALVNQRYVDAGHYLCSTHQKLFLEVISDFLNDIF